MASRPALPLTRSGWREGGVRTWSRGSGSVARRRRRADGRLSGDPRRMRPPHPLPGAAKPPNCGGSRSRPPLHPWSGWRADPPPPPGGVKSRGYAWRRAAGAAPAPPRLPPPSLLPPRAYTRAIAGITQTNQPGHSGRGPAAPRFIQLAADEHRAMEAAHSGRTAHAKKKSDIFWHTKRNGRLQTHLPHAMFTFTTPHHHHPHQYLLLYQFTFLGAP